MRQVRLNCCSWFCLVPILTALALMPVIAENGGPLVTGSPLVKTDFETGDRQGWTGYGCRVEIVSDDVYQGRYACKAWLDQEWGGGLFTTFGAPKGRYQVTMHVKTAPGTTGRCFAGADKFGGKVSQAITESDKWIEIVFEVRLKNPLCELHVWGPKIAGGWVLLDEVSVVPL